MPLAGIGVSAGIVLGQVLLVGRAFPQVVEKPIKPDQLAAEIARYHAALDESRKQLHELKKRVAEVLGEQDASIFEAHLMLLNDRLITDEVVHQIQARLRNADFVFYQSVNRYMEALQQVEDPYLRERIIDVRDVAARVIRNIQGESSPDLSQLEEPRIVIAHDLSPSDTATMHRANVIGFATEIGSRTSHTAIMARSLGIPAVVGVDGVMEKVKTGDFLILDGDRGILIANPDERTIEDYQQRLLMQDIWYHNLEAESSLPAETLDGYRVQLAANIEFPEEVEIIKRSYGVGIGLFRTEYLFINQNVLPDEENQFAAYRRAAEDIHPQSIIIRTLDIGGDKFLSQLNLPSELNPFLGIRAIRFCLARPDIFLVQLRAILRASAFGKIRMMFPMIATVEELQMALNLLQKARESLDAQGLAYNPHMDIGIMIEVPSAALLADRLARMVNFFSIGTNDLIQYSLAADRSNPAISYLYQPSHPAIIRLLRGIVAAANANGIWVSLCGEMGSDPLWTPLILGVGIQELSMSHTSIGPIKRLLRRMRLYEAEELVGRAEHCDTAEEVRTLCENFVRQKAPELLTAENR